MNPPDPIPLSALNQYAYCPRRCFLIHVEGEFADNVHTVSGSREHERVDQLHHEIKAEVRVEFSIPVWSERLGLSGRCDVVEFHPDGTIYPVEYKHGKRKQWLNDDLQLAAQALCLSEMTGRPVPRGAIFHTQSKRRREVDIDAALAAQVADTAAAIRVLFERGISSPPPLADPRRCGECSLQDICQPDLVRARSGLAALAKTLFEGDDAGLSEE
jgi:CRISPR-associated exonuclease Cas4